VSTNFEKVGALAEFWPYQAQERRRMAENTQNLAGQRVFLAKFPMEISIVRNLPASNQANLLCKK